MKHTARRPLGRIALVSAAAGVLLAAGPLRADDEKKEPGLYLTGDLGFLLTSGNSKSSSLGMKLDVARLWTKQAFRFSAGALRQASSPARVAIGTPDDFELEVLDPKATAEEYFARAAYDRQISDRLFYTLGGGWERRPFAGINNRWMAGAGIGYALAMGEPTDFRTVLGLTYTNEDPVVDDPAVESDFVGVVWRKVFCQSDGERSRPSVYRQAQAHETRRYRGAAMRPTTCSNLDRLQPITHRAQRIFPVRTSQVQADSRNHTRSCRSPDRFRCRS